jgi:Glycosyl transferases group 1
MAPASSPEVLIVSAGDTFGWRASERELAGAVERAGVKVRLVGAGTSRQVRTFMLTDLVQALAARRVASRALAEENPAAIIYCSLTAALLWPRPGAIWFDSLAAENRPGRHGVWQRVVERRRIAAAPLVLTMAEGSLDPIPVRARPEAIVVPVPVEPSGPIDGPRDIDVLAYAGDPEKRQLELMLSAWQRARHDGETLVVAGIDRADRPPGVRFTGRLTPEAFRELARRARVYLAAARREDYGIAPLEALADGCMLVTTPSPGPYPALRLARALDSRLVREDPAPALRSALDDPRSGYAARAAELLRPFRRAAVDATIVERVLPRLLPGWKAP